MACSDETTHTFSIQMTTDPTSSTSVDELLTFCLVIEKDLDLTLPLEEPKEIAGTVDELSSWVRGRLTPTGFDTVNTMTLEFDWDMAHVFMVGLTHPESGERVEFVGRFKAFERTVGITRESADAGAQLSAGPGDGDTGTGTGQQT